MASYTIPTPRLVLGTVQSVLELAEGAMSMLGQSDASFKAGAVPMTNRRRTVRGISFALSSVGFAGQVSLLASRLRGDKNEFDRPISGLKDKQLVTALTVATLLSASRAYRTFTGRGTGTQRGRQLSTLGRVTSAVELANGLYGIAITVRELNRRRNQWDPSQYGPCDSSDLRFAAYHCDTGTTEYFPDFTGDDEPTQEIPVVKEGAFEEIAAVFGTQEAYAAGLTPTAQ